MESRRKSLGALPDRQLHRAASAQPELRRRHSVGHAPAPNQDKFEKGVRRLSDRGRASPVDAWKIDVRDLKQVLKVTQAVFLTLLHNNEGCLRVGLEIATDHFARNCLNWNDGDNWFVDDKRREWFRSVIEEKLGLLKRMDGLAAGFGVEDGDPSSSDGFAIGPLRSMKKGHGNVRTNQQRATRKSMEMAPMISALTDIDMDSDHEEDALMVPKKSFHAKVSVEARARAQSSELERCIKEAQDRMASLHEAEKADAHTRLDSLLQKQQAAEKRLADLLDKQFAAEKSLEDANRSLEEANRCIADLQAQIRQLTEENARLRSQLLQSASANPPDSSENTDGHAQVERQESAAKPHVTFAWTGRHHAAVQTEYNMQSDLDELMKECVDRGIESRVRGLLKEHGLSGVWERLYRDASERIERRNALQQRFKSGQVPSQSRSVPFSQNCSNAYSQSSSQQQTPAFWDTGPLHDSLGDNGRGTSESRGERRFPQVPESFSSGRYASSGRPMPLDPMAQTVPSGGFSFSSSPQGHGRSRKHGLRPMKGVATGSQSLPSLCTGGRSLTSSHGDTLSELCIKGDNGRHGRRLLN